MVDEALDEVRLVRDPDLEVSSVQGPPARGLEGVVEEKPSHEDVTRRRLAYLVTGLVSIISLAVLAAIVVAGIAYDEMERYVEGVFVPVLALTGPILGFYFAERRR